MRNDLIDCPLGKVAARSQGRHKMLGGATLDGRRWYEAQTQSVEQVDRDQIDAVRALGERRRSFSQGEPELP
jgi:hypothetical protein